MKIEELPSKIDLKILNSMTDVEITGVIVTDIVSDVVTNAKKGNLLITAQVHNTLISAAKLVDAAAIIFTIGREPQPDVVNLADKAGITLFSSAYNAYELAIKINKLGL